MSNERAAAQNAMYLYPKYHGRYFKKGTNVFIFALEGPEEALEQYKQDRGSNLAYVQDENREDTDVPAFFTTYPITVINGELLPLKRVVNKDGAVRWFPDRDQLTLQRSLEATFGREKEFEAKVALETAQLYGMERLRPAGGTIGDRLSEETKEDLGLGEM